MSNTFIFVIGLLCAFIQNLFFQFLIWLSIKGIVFLGVDMSSWQTIHSIALACIIQILFYVKNVSDSVIIELEEENFEEEE